MNHIIKILGSGGSASLTIPLNHPEQANEVSAPRDPRPPFGAPRVLQGFVHGLNFFPQLGGGYLCVCLPLTWIGIRHANPFRKNFDKILTSFRNLKFFTKSPSCVKIFDDSFRRATKVPPAIREQKILMAVHKILCAWRKNFRVAVSNHEDNNCFRGA